MVAFNGEITTFDRGNADFFTMGMEGREEVIKKGTVSLNIFMYVIRQLEEAVDGCEPACATDDECGNDRVHSWDESVCYYTGSIEGQDGLTSEGRLLHQLADKRCANFKTCGKNGDQATGTAKLNYDILQLFLLGKFQLQTGNCDRARPTVEEISKLMYIPLIQGTLRYAYKLSELKDKSEKSKAEGAVFAAAVLPRIFAANEAAAKTIYDNMGVHAFSTHFAQVKYAFESVYTELGISCSDVGGLWNVALGDYYKDAEPCLDEDDSTEMFNKETLLGALGGALGGLLSCLSFGILLWCPACEQLQHSNRSGSKK